MTVRAILLAWAGAACALSTPPGKAVQPATARLRAYRAASVASSVSWSLCAIQALSKHPTLTLPATHVRVTVLQALSPLPLLAAAFDACGAGEPTPLMRRATAGLAVASAWLAAGVAFAPRFTATVAKASPQLTHMAHSAAIRYPPALRAFAVAAHSFAAFVCLSSLVFAERGADRGLPRRGNLLWAPVAACFAGWALVAAAAPFPLATLPTMMGRRLSRAFGGFSVLYAAVAYGLFRATDDDRADTVATLEAGVRRAAAAHVVANAAKVALEAGVLRAYYPAAFSRPVAAIGGLASFALALAASVR